jgi:hypothetical protein
MRSSGNITLFLLFVFCILFFNPKLLSQNLIQKHDTSLEAKYDSIAYQKDAIDILKKTCRIKSKPDTAKTIPGKVYLSFFPAVGYTLEAGGLVSGAFNISFYTSKPDSTNLSVINTGVQYSIQKQLIIPVITSIWTKDNRYNILADWRYYKYPSYTYGLGANTSLSNADQVDYSYIRAYQEVLRHFNSYYYVGLGYNYDYHYNIQDLGEATDYNQYSQGNTKTTSSGVIAQFMYDSRTNINNPRQSSLASITYRYNSTLLGSDQNWQSVLAEFRKYISLAPHSKNVLAFWSWNEFVFGGKAPYFDLPSNGWDTYSNTARGYIQSRFRGTNFLYDECEYRFGITHNGLIGGVVFCNAETATEWPSGNFQKIDFGKGIGIRIKLNKYSNVNLCIDYGIGDNGSQGFFFNLGEVF